MSLYIFFGYISRYIQREAHFIFIHIARVSLWSASEQDAIGYIQHPLYSIHWDFVSQGQTVKQRHKLSKLFEGQLTNAFAEHAMCFSGHLKKNVKGNLRVLGPSQRFKRSLLIHRHLLIPYGCPLLPWAPGLRATRHGRSLVPRSPGTRS